MRDYATKLRKVNPEVFFIESYINEKGSSAGDFIKYVQKHNKLNCGTTACAVGHLPIFYPKDFEYKYENFTLMVAATNSKKDLLEEQVCEFLGISRRCYHVLFFGSYYSNNDVRPSEVADRLNIIAEMRPSDDELKAVYSRDWSGFTNQQLIEAINYGR